MKQPTPPDSNIVAIERPSKHKRPRKVPRAPTTTSALDPPADLPLSDAARVEWRRIAASLPLLGVDMQLDRALVVCYVQSVAQLADVRALWAAEGAPATVKRPSGLRPHPLVELARQLQRDVATFGEQLGLSPKGRRVLGVQIVTAAPPSGRSYFDD